MTVDGITYIFNEDGSITCNGTASADSILDISQNIQKINGTNKKIVGLLTGSQVPSKITLLSYTSNFDTTTGLILSEVNKSLQVKMQENKDYITFRIIVYRGTTVNNQTVYYQILDTSETDLTYEQYGVSPSPDYPSSIVAVGSNVNLANKDNITNLYFNQNQISVGSTSKTMIENCLPNTTYTISKIKSTKFRVCTTNKTPQTNESIIDYTYNDNGDKITITTSDKAKYMCIYYYDSGTDTLEEQGILDSIKIEKGKVATPWSPHGQGCIKVTKCNKNLFPLLKSQSKENKGIIFSYNAETQEFSAKGTTTDTSFYTTLTFEELKYLSKDKKYILSISNLMPTKCMVALTKINKINNGIINEGKKQTTVDNLDKYKPDGFMFYGQNLEKGTKIDFTFKAQLEEGSTATEYEQHEEQSYIMPVQQEMLKGDYFDFDNEEEINHFEKYVFTGEENWYKSGTTTDTIFAVTMNIPNWNAVSDTSYVLSNRFTVSSKPKIDSVFIYNNGKSLRLCFDASKINTIEQVKSFLKDNNTYCYYKRKTEKKLPFTDEQKAVAKELNNARTYKNVTNITTDSKAILSLDYAKDLETLLNNTQALAVNNASEGV